MLSGHTFPPQLKEAMSINKTLSGPGGVGGRPGTCMKWVPDEVDPLPPSSLLLIPWASFFAQCVLPPPPHHPSMLLLPLDLPDYF